MADGECGRYTGEGVWVEGWRGDEAGVRVKLTCCQKESVTARCASK